MEVIDARKSDAVHLAVSFRKLCVTAVVLPFITLLFCFVTAYIFQHDDIHETHCRVSYFLPPFKSPFVQVKFSAHRSTISFHQYQPSLA